MEAVPALPPFGLEQPLDPRFISLERIGGSIMTASMSLGALLAILVATPVAPLSWWLATALLAAWALATLALAWLSYQWPAIAYRHASYTVEADGLEIRRGVFWRTVITLPRSRVQHTDVSQGPIERRFGLGSLVVYTAGTDHARVDLGGLAHGTALAIRDHLLPHERDDAV